MMKCQLLVDMPIILAGMQMLVMRMMLKGWVHQLLKAILPNQILQ